MIPIAKPFIGEDEKKAVADVLNSGIIAQGPKVEKFEKKFAEFCSVKNSVALNSGTAALHTALYAGGIGRGDEVITTPFTFIATANAILMQQAKPLFADINPDTFNIDSKSIKEKITEKTKAIIAVDIYGQLCEYDKIEKIAKDNNLILIEDACQAVNADYNGRMAGSFGDMGCFSFYATKNITCGEGGALTTNNAKYADKAKLFRQHGMSDLGAYDYDDVGYNYRTTDINAAILLVQLKRIEELTQKRIQNALYFNEHFKDIEGIQIPVVKEGFRHVYHQYTLKVNGFRLSRDELMNDLRKKGIDCRVYYPKLLHLCSNFSKMGYKEGDLPVAEKVNNQVLSLPVHPYLSKEELDLIISSIKEA